MKTKPIIGLIKIIFNVIFLKNVITAMSIIFMNLDYINRKFTTMPKKLSMGKFNWGGGIITLTLQYLKTCNNIDNV